MTHVVLLGDSIFDNGRYVPGQPDVVRQLRSILAPGERATLLALDGAVASGVHSQLSRVPGDATHLIVSVGGNDALRASSILASPVGSVAQAVDRLADAQAAFALQYEPVAAKVAETGLPAALCTIYDTPPSAPDQKVIRSALALFNDIISRAAFRHGLDLVDLRLICRRDEDYANPIEPSAAGGAKISAAIAQMVAAPPYRGSRVFAGI